MNISLGKKRRLLEIKRKKVRTGSIAVWPSVHLSGAGGPFERCERAAGCRAGASCCFSSWGGCLAGGTPCFGLVAAAAVAWSVPAPCGCFFFLTKIEEEVLVIYACGGGGSLRPKQSLFSLGLFFCRRPTFVPGSGLCLRLFVRGCFFSSFLFVFAVCVSRAPLRMQFQ